MHAYIFLQARGGFSIHMACPAAMQSFVDFLADGPQPTKRKTTANVLHSGPQPRKRKKCTPNLGQRIGLRVEVQINQGLQVAAHRDPNVIKTIRDMGHIVCFHGGGTTGYEQVNDTHLHARLQADLQAVENRMAHSQLQENRAAGTRTVPTMSRVDVCTAVETVCQNLPHREIASEGYRQTGHDLPLEGDILMTDICRDLSDVYRSIDPHDDPAKVGTKIRDAARDTVEEMCQRNEIQTWADAVLLVEEYVH